MPKSFKYKIPLTTWWGCETTGVRQIYLTPAKWRISLSERWEIYLSRRYPFHWLYNTCQINQSFIRSVEVINGHVSCSPHYVVFLTLCHEHDELQYTYYVIDNVVFLTMTSWKWGRLQWSAERFSEEISFFSRFKLKNLHDK